MNTNKNQPLVTVYIPTYNRVELLKRAVKSVMSQDYRNIELIVVDDGSTDSTHEYLAEMAEQDPRFKYFINEKNSGACVSRNRAIFAANGEFITGLDDDDYFMPHHISSFLNQYKKIDKGCIALYSHAYLKTKNRTEVIERIKYCHSKHLLAHNWIGNQIFTKTIYLQEIGGFEKSLPAWQDLECWYRLLNSYNAKACLSPQLSYTVDISHPHERISAKKLTSILRAYNIFCDLHKLSTKERNILKLHLDAYTNKPISFESIIDSFFYLPNKMKLRKTIQMVFLKVKKTIKLELKNY